MRYEMDGFEVELDSGYEIVRTRRGEGVRYQDLDGLSKAIALSLVLVHRRLQVAELRFLRRFCDLKQSDIARLMRVDGRTVSNWERGRETPIHADLVMRLLAAANLGLVEFNVEMALSRANAIGEPVEVLRFSYHDGWQDVASTRAVGSVTNVSDWIEVDAMDVVFRDSPPMLEARTNNHTVRLFGTYTEYLPAVA